MKLSMNWSRNSHRPMCLDRVDGTEGSKSWKSISVYHGLKEPRELLATTDYIIDETATRLRCDLDHAAAVGFLDLMKTTDQTAVLRIFKIDNLIITKAIILWDELFDQLISWRKRLTKNNSVIRTKVSGMRSTEIKLLHGWDDEKIYFWDEELNKEWCVTDEAQLYNQLVQICREYFKKYKTSKSSSK